MLGSALSAHEEMGNERDYREEQKQVNQAANDVKGQKSHNPRDKQQDGEQQEWTESHLILVPFSNPHPFSKIKSRLPLSSGYRKLSPQKPDSASGKSPTYQGEAPLSF